jgi:hypothetical protein
MTQKAFADKILPIVIVKGADKGAKVTPDMTSALRACNGSLLYLCMSRLDLVADVCILQTKVNEATVADLKMANSVVNRAKSAPHLGIIYMKISGPRRVLSITDSSFATSKTSYAIEGVAAGVAQDHGELRYSSDVRDMMSPALLSGWFHVLVHSSKKAKRISHGASHAESLAAYSGSTHVVMIQLRITEISAPMPLNKHTT